MEIQQKNLLQICYLTPQGVREALEAYGITTVGALTMLSEQQIIAITGDRYAPTAVRTDLAYAGHAPGWGKLPP